MNNFTAIIIMSLNPLHNLNKNIEQIANFPDNPTAHIKAYGAELKITNEGIFDKTYASLFGTDFQKTITVIDKTCRNVIESFAPENEASLDAYHKAERLLNGLDNIRKIYNNRYELQKIDPLTDLIKEVRTALESFKNTRDILEEKVKVQADKIYAEPVIDEMNDWINIATDGSRAYQGVPTYLPYEGQRPGKLETFSAGISTATEIIKGVFFSYAYEPIADAPTLYGQKRVANPGRQLGGEDVLAFIRNLSSKTTHETVHDFFLASNTGINVHSLVEIKKILDRKNFKIGSTIIIPINFVKEGRWERNHISLILIKDNIIEFYDPKGIYSQYRPLADGNTLSNVLDLCKTAWTTGGMILENPHRHQTDAHNCGVFVCRHLHRRFREESPMGVWPDQTPALSEIEDFRQTVLDIAYPKPLPKTDESTAPFGNIEAEDELDALLADRDETI